MDPFTVLVLLALAALAIALSPKPKIEDARPASLGDFSFPTATEDRFIPILFGTAMQKGPNVVWYDDLQKVPITEDVPDGKFGKTKVVVGFKYYLGMQMALVRGGPVSLRKIWIGEKLIYDGTVVTTDSTLAIDKPRLFGGTKLGHGGVVGDLAFYTGTTTQAVNAYLATFQDAGAGTNRTPRYTKLCHVVWEGGYLGTSTSIAPWSFELTRIPNGLGLSTGDSELNGGYDANPMNVAYEVITDTEWGMRHAAADVDVAAFTDAAETLADEGNGFSMIVDRQMECGELLEEIERQIEGKIFTDPTTGKWTVKLIRDDYAVLSVPHLQRSTNVVQVTKFQRLTWYETSNDVRLVYADRADDYKEKPAYAQDSANQILQGGGSVITGKAVPQTFKFPGVKDTALASKLAWRELRKVSYPLISATFEVTRSLRALSLGDVVTFSGTVGNVSYDHLPLRVLKINRGTATQRTLVLECVQDIFRFTAASFGDAPPSKWSPQIDDLQPFADLIVFESPRGLTARAPDFDGSFPDLLWCGGVRQSNEVGFTIMARVSPDAYVSYGDAYGTLFKGEVTSTLNRGAGASASFTITMGSAADKSDVLAAFVAGLNPTEVGTNLRHLILVESEFMLVTTMASGTGNEINCTGVYRGVLDTVQADHAAGAVVWFIFMGGSLTDNAVAAASTVDVKLLPFSDSDIVLEAAVTAETITTVNRLRLPIPPGRLLLNGTIDDTTNVSLEGAGSGDTIGIDLQLRRRDYRCVDDVRALTTDAATLFPDFPTLNTTEYQVEVRNDPAGANTLLFTLTYDDGPTFRLERNDILQALDGVLPTTLGVVVLTRHVYETVTYSSLYDLPWKFTVATGLTGQFNFGALDQNETSNLYTATQNGTYNFTINTALATGNVEYRLNGGAWTTLISTGNTTGNIPGVVATDTIEIRHTCGTAGTQTFLAMDAPSTGQDGYAVLFKV